MPVVEEINLTAITNYYTISVHCSFAFTGKGPTSQMALGENR
jgi:hypothetical protein